MLSSNKHKEISLNLHSKQKITFVFLLPEYSDAKTLLPQILMIGILMLPILSLDKIKVFSQVLLLGRARKEAADGQGWKN